MLASMAMRQYFFAYGGAIIFGVGLVAFPSILAAESFGSSRPTPDDPAVALLVCTPDNCRHRSKPYRARPAWNAYLTREYPLSREGTPAGNHLVGDLLHLFSVQSLRSDEQQ